MMKIVMSCSLLLLLTGCVTKAGLEEILQKIDHNNVVILKRVEALEKQQPVKPAEPKKEVSQK